MGQKVQPIGFRTGITLPWMSTWFAHKADYGEMLVEDYHIREYVDKKFNRQPPYSAVAKVTIDRKSTRLNSSHIPLSRMPSSA